MQKQRQRWAHGRRMQVHRLERERVSGVQRRKPGAVHAVRVGGRAVASHHGRRQEGAATIRGGHGGGVSRRAVGGRAGGGAVRGRQCGRQRRKVGCRVARGRQTPCKRCPRAPTHARHGRHPPARARQAAGGGGGAARRHPPPVQRGGRQGGLHAWQRQRRHDGPLLKQVGVVAHLAQLHEHVHHGHEVAARQGGARGGARHEVLVQELLAARQLAHEHVLVLLGHLRRHLRLEAPHDKGAHDGVQARHEGAVHAGPALHVRRQRVGEPGLELRLRPEQVRHEEVHEGPQLHEAVLQRRAGEQEAAAGGEGEQRLPPLRLVVLDVVSLVQDQEVPLLALEHGGVHQHRLVAGDAHVEGVGLRPPRPLRLPLLDGAVVRQHLQRGRPPPELRLPVQDGGGGHHHQVRPPHTPARRQVRQQADRLDRLAQPHLVCQDAVQPAVVHGHQPVQAVALVRPQQVAMAQQEWQRHGMRIRYVRRGSGCGCGCGCRSRRWCWCRCWRGGVDGHAG